MDATHLDDAQWLARLEEAGDRFVLAAGADDFSVYLYQPGREDGQGAHGRAEIYFVVSGSGEFESGFAGAAFTAGDALFVPAGEAHRFIGAENALVWAAFFGAPVDGIWRSDGGASTLDLALANQPAPARVWSTRWTGAAGDWAGPGLVVGQHMACARLADGIAGGVVVYDRHEDGSLSALWAHSMAEPSRPGGRSATRITPGDEAFGGRYEIQYTDSNGSPIPPVWQLEIAPGANSAQLTWRSNGRELRGIGIVRSDRLFAAWARAIDYDRLTLSLLDLSVAGQAGSIDELFVDPSAAEPGLRMWARIDP